MSTATIIAWIITGLAFAAVGSVAAWLYWFGGADTSMARSLAPMMLLAAAAPAALVAAIAWAIALLARICRK